MKIVFMRHGEGVDDVEDRYGGWGDLPLSEKGARQAQEVIENLKKYNVDLVLSSPLKRAFETAEIAAKGLNLEVVKWLYLKERNTYGLMSGETKLNIKNDYPELLEAYEKDEFVLGCERYEDLLKRLEVMMKRIQEFDVDTVLAVTHGKVLAAITKEFLGKKLDKKEDCCLLEVEVDGSEVKLLNVNGITFAD